MSSGWARGDELDVEISALGTVAFFGAVALAALLPAILRVAILPAVVLEIMFGFALGPQGFGLIEINEVLGSLSELGLAVLFLMAGFEINPAEIRGRPFRLAMRGWLISLAIALGLAFAGAALGLIPAPSFVALAVTTTAIGALLPILRDNNQLSPPYGPYVLAVGAAGEGLPLIALSLLLAGAAGFGSQGAILIAFTLIAAIAVTLADRIQNTHVGEVFRRTMGSSGQFPIRFALFLTVLFVFLGEHFGIDLVLGAFVAGAVARAAVPRDLHDDLNHRLDGIGYGFLVPCFFVASGVELDVAGVLASPLAIAMVPVFTLMMLIVRGVPALLLYHGVLGERQRKALALHSATELPLVVAITAIAMREGIMPGWCGAALVAAGVLTVVVFPVLAGRFLQGMQAERPEP